MRGKNIYEQLSEDVDITRGRGGQGRNAELIKKRNIALVYSYYYLAKIKRKNYMDVLQNLSDIFFITPRRIVDIIERCNHELHILNKERPNAKEVELKLNFLNLKTI